MSQPYATRSRRGSAYVFVLFASMMVVTIGLSSLYLARIQRREVTMQADMAIARGYAHCAIDYAVFQTQTEATWRSDYGTGRNPVDLPIGSGWMTAEMRDPVDGSLTNNTFDPVMVTGIGRCGGATQMVEVTVDFDNGVPVFRRGTWERVVR